MRLPPHRLTAGIIPVLILCCFTAILSVPRTSFAEPGFTGSVVSITTDGSAPMDAPGAAEGVSAGTAVVSVTQSATGDLIDTAPGGLIDWTKGVIIAYGRASIPNGVNKDICDSMAKRAALLDAHAQALAMIQAVNIDGEVTVRSVTGKNSRLLYRLKGLVARVKPFEQVKDNGYYLVKIKVPFYGISGIQTVFMNTFVKPGTAPFSPGLVRHKIVIDARGTGLKPALFITVLDQEGKVVYSARNISRSALQDKGMVLYVTATTIRAADIQAKAVRADGRQHGNIVISTTDARLLTQQDNGNVLAAGNVIVLTDPPSGRIKGCLPFRIAAAR